MPVNLPPNLVGNTMHAIVRSVEKTNNTPRDQGKREREAEAKRQRAPRANPGTSGR